MDGVCTDIITRSGYFFTGLFVSCGERFKNRKVLCGSYFNSVHYFVGESDSLVVV